MNPTLHNPDSTVIKTTVSRCPQCNELTPNATVFSHDGKVYLSRTCTKHGEATFCLSRDGRLYHEAAGPFLGDCCGGGCGSSKPVVQGGADGILGTNALSPATPDELASCVTLIEITQGCNMKCPTCFADALPTSHQGHIPFNEFVAKVEAVITKKGKLEILQLSGGEPTIHPEFIQMLEWACTHPKILCVLVNTNGIRIATDTSLCAEMARIQSSSIRKVHVYLQFDGVQEVSQRELRGGDFRAIRERAINSLTEIHIPVTLAMVVTHENISSLWDTVMFGIQKQGIHGVSFQPEFFSGRNPLHTATSLPEPISVADIITSLCEASSILTFDDLTPTPCGHPMCQWIGWLGRYNDTIVTPRGMGINLPRLQAAVGNRIRYSVDELMSCQCDDSGLGKLIHGMEKEVQKARIFRLFIKPFMDARTWDEDRIARCCTHVIRPDGKLDSFCRFYANGGTNGNHSEGKRKVDLAAT